MGKVMKTCGDCQRPNHGRVVRVCSGCGASLVIEKPKKNIRGNVKGLKQKKRVRKRRRVKKQ